MSAKPSVHRFDAFKLAAQGGKLDGRLDARTLEAVEDQLAEGAGAVPIAWSVTGRRSAAGRPALAIGLDGVVPLVCQRCLGRVDWPVAQRTEVLLARDEAELKRLDDELEDEVVLAQGPLDAERLVEDELVLALPFAPRHEGECPAAGAGRT